MLRDWLSDTEFVWLLLSLSGLTLFCMCVLWEHWRKRRG
jgi:hypothetical protein